MHNEISNNPNILSNELDQAPKTGKYYEDRLHEPELQQRIFDAMDQHFVFTSEEGDGDEIIDWFKLHQNDIPYPLIYKSKVPKVSFLVHKEKKAQNGWSPMIGAPLNAGSQFYQLGDIFYKDKDELEEGEIGTFITFTKTDSGKIIIGAEQIEVPKTNPFFPAGYACHKKLNSTEFKKILDGSSYLRQPQIKEKQETEEKPKKLGGLLKKLFKK